MASNSNPLIWLAVFILVLAAAVQIATLAKRRPRFKRKRFLTENEARLLALLEEALPRRRIMAQVAMGAS
jgi:cytochrome c-type biogenesis protein CcmH/NrfF